MIFWRPINEESRYSPPPSSILAEAQEEVA